MGMISGKTKLCMVIGDPVTHSLSPVLHTAGYAAVGLADQFVYVAATVMLDGLADAVRGMKAIGVHGFSVTMPHKETIVPLLDEVDADVELIGASNTVVRNQGRLLGRNTDSYGVVGALQEIIALTGCRVAVLGAGGAAAASVVGLQRAGAQVTILNRTPQRGQQLAKRLGCQCEVLNQSSDLTPYHVIVNATSAGMQLPPESPLTERQIGKGVVVCDLSYYPLESPLIVLARARGASVVLGTEVLIHQAAKQFEIFTGIAAPLPAMRRALEEMING